MTWPIHVIDRIARDERGHSVSRIELVGVALCAVCRREICDHSDLLFSGISPTPTGTQVEQAA